MKNGKNVTSSNTIVSNATKNAWKACIRQKRIGGSNPPLSAINIENQCFIK